MHCLGWGRNTNTCISSASELNNMVPFKIQTKKCEFLFCFQRVYFTLYLHSMMQAGLSSYELFLLLADLYVKYLKLNYNMVQFGMMKLLIICIFLTQIWILDFFDLEEFPFNYIITGLQVEHMVLHIDQLYLSHHNLCETSI